MATVYLPDVRKTVSRLAAGKNTNGDDVASSLQDWSARWESYTMSENARMTIGY